MKQWLRLIAVSLPLFGVSIAFAHHDAANHATEGKPISWQGTVVLVSWDGAHVVYRVEVKDAGGASEAWVVQGGSPKRLASRGIYKKTVNAGDTVTVAGYLNPYNKIITPVYFATVDGGKLFVGYARDDAGFSPPTN
jgi:hypothetical protein